MATFLETCVSSQSLAGKKKNAIIKGILDEKLLKELFIIVWTILIYGAQNSRKI